MRFHVVLVQFLGWLSHSSRRKQHLPLSVAVIGDFQIVVAWQCSSSIYFSIKLSRFWVDRSFVKIFGEFFLYSCGLCFSDNCYGSDRGSRHYFFAAQKFLAKKALPRVKKNYLIQVKSNFKINTVCRIIILKIH